MNLPFGNQNGLAWEFAGGSRNECSTQCFCDEDGHLLHVGGVENFEFYVGNLELRAPCVGWLVTSVRLGQTSRRGRQDEGGIEHEGG